MRHLLLFGFSLLTVLFGFSVRADDVRVKGADKAIAGVVKTETAKEVVIEAKKKATTIPSSDVIEIHYEIKPIKLVGGGEEGTYRIAKTAEKEAADSSDPAKRKAALKKAIANYNETLKKMDKNVYAARHFEYKIAILSLDLANVDQAPIDAALAKLQLFKTRFPNSWQINHVLREIAQLQMNSKDYKGAEQTYQEVADMELLPDDVRRDAEMKIVDISVKAGKIDLANKRLDALTKKAGNDVLFASRVRMYKADILIKQKKTDEAEPLLKQLLKESSDRQVRAMVHNKLGECLFDAKRYDEALWEFLWVDTVYNQDKEERAKALFYLWRTFAEQGNAERAQDSLQALVGDAQYAGTEYQRRALAKSK